MIAVDLATLVNYLQDELERERARLANELHNELGGSLAAASINLSALERDLPAGDSAVEARLVRVTAAIEAAAAFERRTVEELRPPVLQYVGLFGAFRWQLQTICDEAGLRFREQLDGEDPAFVAEAALALFRIQQAALLHVVARASAKEVHFRVVVRESLLEMRIADDGVDLQPESRDTTDYHRLLLMRHRAERLGGTCSLESGSGGVSVNVVVPLAGLLAA